MNDKNGYFYEEQDGQICIFIYIKLSRVELAKALPMSEPSELEKDYLVATFINGTDYIGSANLPEIKQRIIYHNMTQLNTLLYNAVKYNMM